MRGTVIGLRRIGALLESRDFLAIWGAGLSEGAVRWTEILVIGVYAQQQTQSPLIVASMVFANMVPGALFGAFTGALAERVDRRTLLLCGFALMCAIMLTMAWLAASGRLELWQVAIATFLSGTIWTTDYPVRRTLLGEIAGIGRSATAITFDIATGTAMIFLGPILGGFLLRDIGMHGFYFAGLACFAVAFLCVAAVRFKPEVAVVTHDRILRVIAEGLRHLRHNPPVAGVLMVTVVLNFFGYSFISMLPVIGAEKLELGPVLVGLLMSMEGAGRLARIAGADDLRRAAVLHAAVRGRRAITLMVAVVVFSTLPWFGPCLLVLFIGGLGEAGFASMQATILFEASPPAMRRRMMGVLVVCIGAGPLGMLHTGLMAEWLGADVAVGVIAAEGLVGLALCLWAWPALRKSAIAE